MADHNILGAEGEKAAVHYLESKRYAILEKNWRYRKDELDIIAEEAGILVVVEVKTRAAWQLEEAEKSVTRAKQRRIVRAADAYMKQKNLFQEVRFDVMVLTQIASGFEIRHIPDAFYAIT
jgi:putative endonuclease